MLKKEISAETGLEVSTTAEVNNVKPNYSQTQYCTLLLFPCGTLVKSKYGNIEGMITCQNIRFDKVQYEVSYFNNGEQKAIWMNENEFTTDVKKYAIGFAKPHVGGSFR